jgi:hypothetical protein
MNKSTVFLLALLLLPFTAFSQFFTKESEGNCKVDASYMKPLIQRFNPFFIEHHYDDESKNETAKLSDGRIIIIDQRACTRHHIVIQYIISPDELRINSSNYKLLLKEWFGLLNKLFFADYDYLKFKTELESTLSKKIEDIGMGRAFTFPINDRTFIAQMDYGDWGSKLQLEIVKYIYTEKINLPGVPEYTDDGYFQPVKLPNKTNK